MSDEFKRIGIALRQHVHERLQDITKMLGVSQSRLIEAIVSTMSLEELRELVARQDSLEKLEESLHRKASREVLGIVRGRSSDHIRQMAVAADRSLEERAS